MGFKEDCEGKEIDVKVLILGGTGAMGMSLVPILQAKGDEVFVTSRKYRESGDESENIHYLTGNAHEEVFLAKVLEQRYDAIVDFMFYNEGEFMQRADWLLASCEHYFFLSSSRVYAESSESLTEESPRLLDACKNRNYLKTSEYALDKAREENILMSKEKRNWTIIRPYITYNSNRLQLGCYEKESWLYRALNGRTIVFTEDMSMCKTTLTYGKDVAEVISRLIGNRGAYGEIFHITSNSSITWGEVLKIYLEVIEDMTGRHVPVLWLKDSKKMEAVLNRSQVRFDRLYDRVFDNSKVNRICGDDYKYIDVREGIAMCLKEFLERGESFRRIYWNREAYMDKLTHERTSLSEIPEGKLKVKYLVCRYTPYLEVKNWVQRLRWGDPLLHLFRNTQI